MNNPKIQAKPSKYAQAERWIKSIQWLSLAGSLIIPFFINFISVTKASEYGITLTGILVSAIFACPYFIFGALAWSLLAGVLAIFDIANDTADNKRILLHSVKAAEKSAPATSDT